MNPSLDLLYRLAAFGISIYCVRKAWYGYVERKILFVSDDWWDWSRWSRQEVLPRHHADPLLDADGRHGRRGAAMPRRCDRRLAAGQLNIRHRRDLYQRRSRPETILKPDRPELRR
ncbi:hypothetical protein L6654_05155 [Bradyrhizobium sp. WYCCWR 13023]|uniref:Uncharacterized protein n=1 Tax=Bradyrhizobium zhengyangense TaxID=2911009 RepID=A0A9X1U5V8_9BRAD|nr:hypothetical protein [Bradyrhizobium zhengyangense]MCG2626010.1 hypothetical protein [Bradyrhizobium zhengyangense]